MQDKAEATGLKLRSKEEPGAQDCLADIDDSFKEFMFGVYSVLKKRFWRPFGKGVNESVHESVWRRWRENPAYRPESLRHNPDAPAVS
jgi:hypothetical protein